MIKRRIHTLKAEIKTSPSGPVTDELGNITFPESETKTIERSCRAESNTVDGRKVVEDGVNYDYSYLVFTDVEIESLPVNTSVDIFDDLKGEVFGKGVVVKFERGQRVTRIWLK
ncbi:hypothetical protein [Sphingobacterium corticibacter]|uniref:Uncharacterized protein n=1 Tax=Sphingobacterium corticibacter TaxID=2171749 RepID=A0A2T8HLW5_9SPHI|nr:hypothetical protein [Sphingobacterium corticibacter]PVH26302.1 hypothetical protein DC487_01355 [Sphingobacterium corticibacter]